MNKTKNHTSIPNLPSQLFWDTDIDELDWNAAYIPVITRVVERGDQNEIDEIIRFYGDEKVVTAVRDEIYFLPNYAIDRALKFFPELKKEEMYCYLNRKDKPYDWI